MARRSAKAMHDTIRAAAAHAAAGGLVIENESAIVEAVEDDLGWTLSDREREIAVGAFREEAARGA